MNLPALPSKIVSTTIGIVLLVALAFWGKSCYDRGVVEKAALAASQKHLLDQADSLRGALKVSDARIAHDTVVLKGSVTRYQTLRDTLIITDTIQVKATLAAADVALTDSKVAIAGLIIGIQTRDATIYNRDSTIRVLNARFPTTRSRIVTDLKWLIIGAAADELYHAVRSKRL